MLITALGAAPPDELICLETLRLVPLLPALLLPPLVLRSAVVLREVPASLAPPPPPPGLSIQSKTSACDWAAMPTSNMRWPTPPFLHNGAQQGHNKSTRHALMQS